MPCSMNCTPGFLPRAESRQPSITHACMCRGCGTRRRVPNHNTATVISARITIPTERWIRCIPEDCTKIVRERRSLAIATTPARCRARSTATTEAEIPTILRARAARYLAEISNDLLECLATSIEMLVQRRLHRA